MTVSFTIIPLAEFYEEENKTFLDNYDVQVPAKNPVGRYPTIAETQTLLESKNELVVKYSGSGSDWSATARLDTESPDKIPVHYFSAEALQLPNGEICVCSFSGEYEMVEAFVENLAQLCGPFVLLINGESPRIIVHGN